jgi:hypothetical protein
MTKTDKVIEIWFWILMPAMMLTTEHPNKTVRFLGILASFPIFPFTVIPALIWAIPMLLFMIWECA